MFIRFLTLLGLLVTIRPAMAQPLPADATARLGGTRLAAPRGYGLALSPDGKLLASGCGTSERWQHDAVIWDADTCKVLCETQASKLHLDSNGRKSLAFSANGKLLAVSSWRSGAILLWDLARPLTGEAAHPAPMHAHEADRLWDILGDDDPQRSDRALWALVAAPELTVARMSKRLNPARVADAGRIQELIKELDNATFARRDGAIRELCKENELALPPLRAAVKSARSLEHRRRIETVIEHLQSGIELPGPIRAGLQELRALEVLERIGSEEARKLVALVAKGHADALLTREALVVLARWQAPTVIR